MVNRLIFLDCRELTERKVAHEYLKKLLDFPEYYGHNLDALYDCLSEMSDCQIVLQYEEVCLEGSYARRIIEVLKEAAFENPNFKLISFNI